MDLFLQRKDSMG
jgi:hypothetical protein